MFEILNVRESMLVNAYSVTHWGRVTHIYFSKVTIIVPDNGLSPGLHQAIIWTNDGILLILIFGTNFSENFMWNYTFFIRKKCIWKGLQNGGHFAPVSMC